MGLKQPGSKLSRVISPLKDLGSQGKHCKYATQPLVTEFLRAS